MCRAVKCRQCGNATWAGCGQHVDSVMRGVPANGQVVNVPPGEVNYAAGGKSSAYEKGATSGKITFTTASAGGPVEGTVQAAYADGSTVSGPFKATFCANGQQF